MTAGPTVSIVPNSPTAETDLSAIVSGLGGNVAYRWSKNGVLIDGETGPVLPRGTFQKGDVVSLTVTSGGMDATASTTIMNGLPRIIAVPFSPEHVTAGMDIIVAPQAVDPDGDTVSFRYQWTVNGKDIPGDAPVLKGNWFKRGDSVTVTITPADDEASGEPFVSKPFVIPDAPPHFVSTPPREFTAGTYAYRAQAVDPDGDPVTYALGQAPRGMTIDEATGFINWTVGADQAGTHEIEIIAQDSEGMKAYQRYTLAITIPHEGAQ